VDPTFDWALNSNLWLSIYENYNILKIFIGKKSIIFAVLEVSSMFIVDAWVI
jgi:hypothetical protein